MCSDSIAMHCSTGFSKLASPLSSVALQNRLTACLCHCIYTYKDLLFIQLCRDATPRHCSTGLGKMHSPLSSAALQHRLTACLCHCNHTYEDLLFIHVCSDATPRHCSTGFGKLASPLFSAALQKGSQHACSTATTPTKICSSYRCAVMQHKSTPALVLAN